MSETTSYRHSHSSPGYGQVYEETYEHGYYADQWRLIERPLLEGIFAKQRESDPKTRYLDFACGTGRILNVAEAYFEDCSGVDVSAEMLELARAKCVRSRILKQDITKQPLDEGFDLITAFRFFLHAEPELTDAVLQQLHDLLEDDGALVLNIHVNAYSPLGVFYRLRAKFQQHEQNTTKSFSVMEAALEKNGFVIEKAHWFGYLPRPSWMFERAVGALMLPVENLIGRVPFLRTTAQCFLLECRKK